MAKHVIIESRECLLTACQRIAMNSTEAKSEAEKPNSNWEKTRAQEKCLEMVDFCRKSVSLGVKSFSSIFQNFISETTIVLLFVLSSLCFR